MDDPLRSPHEAQLQNAKYIPLDCVDEKQKALGTWHSEIGAVLYAKLFGKTLPCSENWYHSSYIVFYLWSVQLECIP